ncbi:MAG: NUDIX domain-containing protein [Elusimicrobia bacterium]|nr:NUDIX domain-containing protein [Elusimicrobiota bacterium]
MKEYAAGGIVGREGKILLVKVTNLKGEEVWTFPKGHLEGREKPLAAALREVEEETGWRCRNKGLIGDVRYHFQRNGRLVDKKVRWYRMEPVAKTGKPDAVEIMKTKWVSLGRAMKSLRYPSDLRLLKRYQGKEAV